MLLCCCHVRSLQSSEFQQALLALLVSQRLLADPTCIYIYIYAYMYTGCMLYCPSPAHMGRLERVTEHRSHTCSGYPRQRSHPSFVYFRVAPCRDRHCECILQPSMTLSLVECGASSQPASLGCSVEIPIIYSIYIYIYISTSK